MPVHKERVEEMVRKYGLGFDLQRPISTGHHAKTVIEFSGNGNGEVSHVVKCISLANAGPEDHAAALMQAIYNYRQLLEVYGVPIVELHCLFKECVGNNEYIIEIAEHGGATIEGEITDGEPAKALATVRAILESVERLFKSATSHILPIGLNFVPRNFTRDANGKIRYIDYFLPYVYPFLTWPPSSDKDRQGLEQWRHYSTKGLLQVFLVHIGRLRPELRDQTEHLIGTRIDQWSLRLGTWWQDRPANQLERVIGATAGSKRGHRKQRKARRIIQGLNLSDLYDLRDCAVLLASRGMLDQAGLQGVFTKTHFDSHQSLDREVFIDCRSKLASLL